VEDIFLDDVIPQDHADLLSFGKVLSQGQGGRDTAFPLLVSIVHMLEPEFLPVPQELEKVPA